MFSNYKLRKDDCRAVIEKLIEIFKETGLGDEVSFFVYGSYFDEWRDGLSDLDAILYFCHIPTEQFFRSKIEAFQSAMRSLYEELPFAKNEHFFADVFIQDAFHGSDGRFYIFDKEKTEGFKTQNDAKMVFGRPFLNEIRPVSLRHEQEIELAHGLHWLRNYLFFEMPKGETPESLSKARNLLKFFRILPRRVSIINDDVMTKTPDIFKKYDYLKHIDYSSLMVLWENTGDVDKLENFIKQWHEPGNTIFRDCWECFEKTLVALVKNTPMMSCY